MQIIQKIIFFNFIYLLPFSIVYSQNSKDLKLKIQGANKFMIEKKYSIAKDLWMEIVKQQVEHSILDGNMIIRVQSQVPHCGYMFWHF